MLCSLTTTEYLLKELISWTNQNAGFISVAIFILTIIIGWVSGLFRRIRNKPHFRITILNQCTFYSTILTKEQYKGLPIHKTAFVVYCNIANIGFSGSEIGELRLGYIINDRSRFVRKKKYVYETISGSDFTYTFKESGHTKVFPFLKQINQFMLNMNHDTYLPVGKAQNGIAYFEQDEAFGNWYPRRNKDKKTAPVVIEVSDVYGRKYRKKINIEYLELEEALKYNPNFGMSIKKYTFDPEIQKIGLP